MLQYLSKFRGVLTELQFRPVGGGGIGSKLLGRPSLIKVIQNKRPEMTVRGFC